jgi:hypothetical protein
LNNSFPLVSEYVPVLSWAVELDEARSTKARKELHTRWPDVVHRLEAWDVSEVLEIV